MRARAAEQAGAVTSKTTGTEIVADLPERKGFRWSEYTPVHDNVELQRILSLPRRPTYDPNAPEMGALVRELTEKYRRPNGTMVLRPAQAFTLREAETVGNVLVSIEVGGGKTLPSLLLPIAFGVERAVLVVPASLKSKLFQLEYPALSKHWRLPQLTDYPVHFPDSLCSLTVVTYHELSRPDTGDVLERLAPQAIIWDEGHRVRHRSSATTKRAVRYWRRTNPHMAILTGSLMNRSITEGAPLAELTLRDGSPFPRDYQDLQAWAWVIDDGAEPGALRRLMAENETPRAAVARRLAETPGVIISTEDSVPAALNILARNVQIPTTVQAALTQLRNDFSTPDGFEFESALDFARYARQLAAGMYYVRTWPRGEPVELREKWLEARNKWFSKVRDYLSSPHAGTGRDSPELLFRAAAAGEWRVPEYAPWAEIRAACKPDSEDVWLSDFLAKDAVKWGKEHRGIIWVLHKALGEKIAELSGWPFYHDSDEHGDALRAEDGSRTIVASLHAFREGSNLQMFSKMLVTTPVPNGQWWQQALGRCHRSGQLADEVTCWVYVHTPELMAAMRSALQDAQFAKEVPQQKPKLLVATFGFSPNPEGR
jgi:hypothetical protein